MKAPTSPQDVVFFIGSLVFIVALLPAIAAVEKPPLFTSASTGLVLAVFAYTYSTLRLYLAASITACTAGCWLVLAAQAL